jgi:hypothetical protein
MNVGNSLEFTNNRPAIRYLVGYWHFKINVYGFKKNITQPLKKHLK